jgi:hypothetical protein
MLIAIKYIPVVSTLVLTLCAIVSVTTSYDSIFTTTFGISLIPAIIVYLAQRILKFCLIHKLLLLYCVVADYSLSIDNKNINVSIAIIGIILLSLLIIKLHNEHYIKTNKGAVAKNSWRYRFRQF